MGGGATKLYNTLTRTLSSGVGSQPLPLPLSHSDPFQPADVDLDPDLCQVRHPLLS